MSTWTRRKSRHTSGTIFYQFAWPAVLCQIAGVDRRRVYHPARNVTASVELLPTFMG